MRQLVFFRIAKSALVLLAGIALCGLGGGVLWLWLSVPRAVSGGREMSFPVSPEGRPLRLLALGDTGTGEQAQLQVAAAMEKWCKAQGANLPDGILLLGDNFYSSGVESVMDPQWQSKFEVPYGSPCLSRLPVYPVLGNHDYRLSPQAQIDYSAVQPRWRMPARFYSVDFGPLARLVAIDTNRVDWCGSPKNCVVDFMNSRLTSPPAGAWRIIIGHHPMISSSSHGRSYDGTFFKYTLRPRVCQIADLYLSGHSHQMEHLRVPECATDFVVAGTGGGDIGRVKDDRPDSMFLKQVYGFLALEFTPSRMVVTFVDESGAVLHKLERDRG